MSFARCVIATAVLMAGCAGEPVTDDGVAGGDEAGSVASAPELSVDEHDTVDAEFEQGQSWLGFFVKTMSFGGNGGSPSGLLVDGAAIFDAFQVRSGSRIDAIRFHWYKPNDFDNNTVATQGWTEWKGGSGGTLRAIERCPIGTAFGGAGGSFGSNRVNSLGFTCREVNAARRNSGPQTRSFGKDKNPLIANLCDDRNLVGNIEVRSGSEIDRITIHCYTVLGDI
jgi:hypothetical protein